MGKKRIIAKPSGDGIETEGKPKEQKSAARGGIGAGTVFIQSTFNNTKILLADGKGNALAWSTSGSLGFKGAKKGTPYAAGKVAEVVADKADALGVKRVDIIVKGVGTGRESSIRTLGSRGFDIASIKDMTPVPFNGPRPKKPRRV